MPIYEYECTECGRVEEALQSITDAPLSQCPHCQGRLHKLISQSTFHLKGAGWYADGYGGKSQQATSKKSESKADGKSDTAASTGSSASSSAGKGSDSPA